MTMHMTCLDGIGLSDWPKSEPWKYNTGALIIRIRIGFGVHDALNIVTDPQNPGPILLLSECISELGSGS